MIHIMRGLPGSGKTAWLKTLPGPLSFHSADAFHMVNGEYRYDPKLAGQAHGICLAEFVRGLLAPKPALTFAVDNTNTTLLELAPYVRICEAFAFPYEIVYLVCSVDVAYVRNTHNVPINTILKMNAALLTEIVPAHWNQRVVF